MSPYMSTNCALCPLASSLIAYLLDALAYPCRRYGVAEAPAGDGVGLLGQTIGYLPGRIEVKKALREIDDTVSIRHTRHVPYDRIRGLQGLIAERLHCHVGQVRLLLARRLCDRDNHGILFKGRRPLGKESQLYRNMSLRQAKDSGLGSPKPA